MQFIRRSARRSPRLRVGLFAGAALLVMAAGSMAVSGPSASAAAKASKSPATGSVWLCKPGASNDPCEFSRAGTTVPATGTQSPATVTSGSPTTHKFNCFYVYPTVSTEKSVNANLTVQTAETDVAIDQASLFSQVCTVWAPMYKQATLSDLAGLSATGGSATLTKASTVAFASLLAAWKQFVAHDDKGRPFILIGHSQGTVGLIHLIATQIDQNATLRKKLVVAILAGGNLQVPSTKTVGATFKHIPLCTSTTETGCAIAWSSFPSEPPADSLFGRAGRGVSLQGDQKTSTGQQVACVNPAALGGGTADLDPWFIKLTQKVTPAPATYWETFPALYSGACMTQGGATWLQVTSLAAAGDTRPVVTESEGPTWGFHTWDINLVLGNLVIDVTGEERAYTKAG